jgi:hypothetical protein
MILGRDCKTWEDISFSRTPLNGMDTRVPLKDMSKPRLGEMLRTSSISMTQTIVVQGSERLKDILDC